MPLAMQTRTKRHRKRTWLSRVGRWINRVGHTPIFSVFTPRGARQLSQLRWAIIVLSSVILVALKATLIFFLILSAIACGSLIAYAIRWFHDRESQ